MPEDDYLWVMKSRLTTVVLAMIAAFTICLAVVHMRGCVEADVLGKTSEIGALKEQNRELQKMAHTKGTDRGGR